MGPGGGGSSSKPGPNGGPCLALRSAHDSRKGLCTSLLEKLQHHRWLLKSPLCVPGLCRRGGDL